jgi:F420-non-reducing hydrogenase iron-sulfur subunit
VILFTAENAEIERLIKSLNIKRKNDMAERFEPKILAFLCKWCSYAAADLAGVSRCQYPPSVRTILTMCSGRVDPVYIIEGLRRGFDGVFVFG